MASERLFEPPIRLKTPPGVSPPFPSRISSVKAAIEFVNSHVEPARRSEFYWKVAIIALDAVANGRGSFVHARAAMHNALTTEGWLAD